MSRAAPFSHLLRVYWEDTDAGGVVFYANHLKFFERARTEWLRARGIGQERLRVEAGVMFVVADTSVRYLAPARLDDWLAVSVDIVEAGRASLTIVQQSRCVSETGERADRPVAEGRIRIGCVDAGTFRARRIPNDILERLE